ncbi:MAG: hydroxyacid dehydrogenase [Planctomycetota bacterium]|nr:hydroxyacid dehydrogenase [Planctomycetota bacterium]MDA1139467.1 hydroxyacid dehydrogenase [Planctomycetota bacterium]
MKKIIVTEDIAGERLDRLKTEFDVLHDFDIGRDRPRLLATVPEFEGMIVRNHTQVNEELLVAATNLKVVGRHGIGLDNVDVAAASRAGVIVTYAPDQNTVSVAELTMCLLIALARDLVNMDISTKAGGWERNRFCNMEIYQKTLGIIGLGKIGFRVAMRARAFGLRILAYDKYLSTDSFNYTESGALACTLDEVLEQSDFVTIHTPLNDETRNFCDEGFFARMKPSAYFLNQARGGLVVEDAIVKALKGRRIAGAALDVRQNEPPGVDELAGMENVILTPHMAGLTNECRERVCGVVCEDVARVLSGLDPIYPAD